MFAGSFFPKKKFHPKLTGQQQKKPTRDTKILKT